MNHIAAGICFLVAIVCYLAWAWPVSIFFVLLGAGFEFAGYALLWRQQREGRDVSELPPRPRG